ncbi:uncharacterized protein FFNC_08276 [Fusarium fujikuroi]|nr:uncharacterized protein FFNC_08276 [Fusarium fujikuroi]
MGNSAGAVHLCTFLLHPSFAELRGKITSDSDACRLRLKAAVFCSISTSFHNPRLTEFLFLQPTMDKQWSRIVPSDFLRLFLLLYGSLDPEDEILGCNKEFIELWRSSTGSSGVELEVQVMDGHNHISSPPALGTNISREEV